MKHTTTSQQFEILVNFLQSHPDLALGVAKSSEHKTRRSHLWAHLAELLNDHGPPVRTANDWKSIWADYKYNLKRKLSTNIKRARYRSIERRVPFNTTEQIVINLLGIRGRHINSRKYVRQQKCTKSEISSIDLDPLTDNTPFKDENRVNIAENMIVQNEINSIVGEPDPVADHEEQQPIEKEFVETTEVDGKDSMILKDILTGIYETQKLISREMIQSNQLNRNSYDIKRRLLQLEQEKFDEMKMQNYELNKQAYIKIELKRKQLELYELKVKGQCKNCTVKSEIE